jgi:hypothetical protein
MEVIYTQTCHGNIVYRVINPSYNKLSPAASIGWGEFVSATWGRFRVSEGSEVVIAIHQSLRRFVLAALFNHSY